MIVSVSEINIFPIKSCQGTSLSQAEATLQGFTHDRQWMLTNHEGQFLTQRQFPLMSQIVPRIQSGDTNFEQARIQLSAPNMTPFDLRSDGEGDVRDVVVWKDNCKAVDEGDDIAAWLSDYLKTPCRLVRMSKKRVRQVDKQFARTEQDQVGFADGYPFLLISDASLNDLNDRLATPEPLPMNRFRPNIVISGCKPFAEDDWKTIRFASSGLIFHIVKPCARCVVTCTDQQTSKVGSEPLKTLSTFRNQMNKILFGQNLVPEGTGIIKVGEELEVLSSAESQLPRRHVANLLQTRS